MLAAQGGYSLVVRILLDHGANFSLRGDQGLTALHRASFSGHLRVTIDLLHAGAPIEARTDLGSTPLHLAAEFGFPEVMKALFDAGANIDCRSTDGSTPLYLAAAFGHLNAVRELLRVGADPMVKTMVEWGEIVPLDMAAHDGHSEVVRELIQQLGVRGCGGASGGVHALSLAAAKRHIDIMAMLTDAGVVDTADALVNAVAWGSVDSVDFLLQKETKDEAARYVNSRADRCRGTALMSSINFCKASTRMVRKLIDAGADTAVTFHFTTSRGGKENFGTLLDATNLVLREKALAEKVPTQNHPRQQLEGIRRLLQQVDAIHASSWLWSNDAPMPPVSVLPPLISWARRRRTVGRHGMLLPRLFR